MTKIIAFDTETTGLEPGKHEIIQIAGAVIVDNRVTCWFDHRARPDKLEFVEQEALTVHGYTIEQLMGFPKRQSMHDSLLSVWAEDIDKFNKNDKAYPLGYNVNFDLGMLQSHFKSVGDDYLGSWINWKTLDVASPINWRMMQGHYVDLADRKLTTVCDYFGIELTNAHDALADIEATIKVANALRILNIDFDMNEPVCRNYTPEAA